MLKKLYSTLIFVSCILVTQQTTPATCGEIVVHTTLTTGMTQAATYGGLLLGTALGVKLGNTFVTPYVHENAAGILEYLDGNTWSQAHTDNFAQLRNLKTDFDRLKQESNPGTLALPNNIQGQTFSFIINTSKK